MTPWKRHVIRPMRRHEKGAGEPAPSGVGWQLPAMLAIVLFGPHLAADRVEAAVEVGALAHVEPPARTGIAIFEPDHLAQLALQPIRFVAVECTRADALVDALAQIGLAL